MTKSIVALLLLIGLSVPVAAQDRPDDRPFQIAIGAFVAASAADLATTQHALATGAGSEGNPILRPFASSPLAFGLAQGAYTAGIGALLFRVHRDHPKAAFWLGVGLTSAELLVATHNARLEGGNR